MRLVKDFQSGSIADVAKGVELGAKYNRLSWRHGALIDLEVG